MVKLARLRSLVVRSGLQAEEQVLASFCGVLRMFWKP